MSENIRDLALAIYGETLEAVRADRLLERAWPDDLGPAAHIYLVGAGKASVAMAQAADRLLGDRLTEGVVVTKRGQAGDAGRIRVLEAGHPIPDDASVEAGRAIAEVAQKAREGDLVICLLSGGASALMELPREGLTLADLQQTTRFLLRSGATIDEMNAVRACLSQLKAGGLARLAAPARVLCFVLSDVLGSPLNVIASGPTYDTPVDYDGAHRILESRVESLESRETIDGVKRVMDYLRQEGRRQKAVGREPGASTAAPTHDSRLTTHDSTLIIGDLWTAIEAAREAAEQRGLRPCVLTGWLQGEAREVAQVFAGIAHDLARTRGEGGFDCYIAGGETTVTVRGEGLGGRCQEIACAAADTLSGIEGVALLAGGTDGTDGPTDAAGGLVDGETAARAREAGWTAQAALAENDAYRYLDAAGALIKTGPTHSNVGDVILVVGS